jgi:hypothetical protein
MVKLSRYILFTFLFLITALCSVSAQGLSRSVICSDTLAEYSDATSILKGNQMYKNRDPSKTNFLFDDKPGQFRYLEPDEEWLQLEAEIRLRNLQYDEVVQWLTQFATQGNDNNCQWARDKIRMILESDRIMDMRTGDVFRPLAPKQLLSQGNLHLFNQVDGMPWKIPIDALTRGMLLTGPQGSGKTRFLLCLGRQLNSADPPIPFFILDPKMGLKNWADYLNAVYIDIDDISIDLSPPPGLDYPTWLRSLSPQLGEVIGVIYGVELIQDISLDLRDKYFKQTGRHTELSLGDLYDTIPKLSNVSSGRRAGYKDAVLTGLNRILTGSGNLFKCRKGIDLPTLFKHNIILGCRSITDEFSARFLAFYLLYYLYESERFLAPSDKLKRVLIFEDATRWLSVRTGFDAASAVSSLTHIYSVLRSSGNGIIAVSQIPHLLDEGVRALSHTIVCVGALHYAEDTKMIAQMMGLNEEQRVGITQLDKQETIGLCAGSAWKKVVHGFTADVPDVEGQENG